MFGVLVIISLLVFVSAIYVAAEFAAVGVRRERIRRMAESGNKFAVALLPYLSDPAKLDRYIAACQVGITITGLLLGAFAQARLSTALVPFFERWTTMEDAAARTTSTVIVLIGLTVFQMVLSELVPKSLALQFPTQCALFTVTPLRWSLALYSWFITGLNRASRLFLRMLGLSSVAQSHIHSPEEIELLIADSRDGGLLEADEHLRLQRALRLGTRPIRQVMVPRGQIDCMSIDEPIEKVIRRVTDSPYSRIPVYRGFRDQIIGVLHTKDVVRALVLDGEIKSVEKLLRPTLFVPRNVTADRVLGEMRKMKKHQAIVVDEFGGLEGLVTLEDILGDFLGELGDEFKKASPRPERLPDGRIRVPGLLLLDEVHAWIGKKWEGDMDTVGGFILEWLDRVPLIGEIVEIEGLKVEITDVSHHAVRWIVVTPEAPSLFGDAETTAPGEPEANGS